MSQKAKQFKITTMKKLILLAALVISSAIFGQGNHSDKKEHSRKGKMEHLKDLSPEQMATLRTKKMALALDLSKEQQNKIYDLQLNEAKTRKEQRAKRNHDNGAEKPKLSSEEKFNKMNERLDKKIAHKKKMKSILSEEQFNKWEQTQRKTSSRKKKHSRNNR